MYTIEGRPKRNIKRKLIFLLALLVLAGCYAAWALFRPLPDLQPTVTAQLKSSPLASKLAWPAEQSAVGIVGSNALETHGKQTPVPTASTAKIITSLVVLDKSPLSKGQPGPTITLGASDKAIFDNYFRLDGSLVPVAIGERINQYQMLQAIMLPSANNMADSLAIWAFGSLDAYSKAANAYLLSHGIKNTVVGKDASGLDPTSTSTPDDMVKIGKLAMQNPVLAKIAGQTTATGIPVANTINNVNGLLGHYNIIGLKTGNSNEAGGAFVSASTTKANGKQVTIVTALMSAKDLVASMKNSVPLIQSSQANFTAVKAVKNGQAIGHYTLPWGGSIGVAAGNDASLDVWNGSTLNTKINLEPVEADAHAGSAAGKITVTDPATGHSVSSAVKLQQPATKPSAWWRLTHPL